MAANIAAEPVALAGRREYLGLAVLGLPTMLLSLDMSVLLLALPQLSADLGANSVQQLWISDIYGFVVSGLLIAMGAVGDRVGRRRLLLIGAVAFTGASVLAAFSSSPAMLIGMRALMGAAGATLMPSTMTLIRTMFQDPKQYGTAIGVWVGFFMGGMALGPIVGGLLLQFFWWGSVFLIGVPVMLLLLMIGPVVLPEYRDPQAGRIDILSALLSLATILPIVYGLKELARYGVAAPQILAIVIGAGCGVAFVRRQRVLSNPMLDLRLFSNRTFRAVLVITVFAAMMAGSNFFIYQYLETVQRLSPLDTGLWLAPADAITIISSQLAVVVGRHIRPGYAIAGGLLIAAVGSVMLTQMNGRGDLPLLISAVVLGSIGIGPMGSLGAGLALSSVPIDKAASAASVTQTSGDFGIAMGIAVLGLVGTTAYRHEVSGRIGPGVPAKAAATARESIAGAVSVAQHLAGRAEAALLASVRDAFATALAASEVCAGLIAVALAVLAATALRHIPPTGTAAATEAAPAEVAGNELAGNEIGSGSASTTASAAQP